VAKKSPLDKIKDAATDAAVSVVGTGQKVVGTAVGQALTVAGAVGARVPSRRRAKAPSAPSRPVTRAEPQQEPRKSQGDPVKPPPKKAPAKKTAAKKTPAKKSAAKDTAAKKSPTKKSAAKKSATKKSATKKSATKKAAPAKKSEG
jgi:hypothetical protein